jgi:acyl carrier protein
MKHARFLADYDRMTILNNDPRLDGGRGLWRVRLLALATQILAKNSVDRPLTADDRLTAAGLSSVDMVNLMLAVEAEFDITIPAADITPHNFQSISTLEALIAKIFAVPASRPPAVADPQGTTPSGSCVDGPCVARRKDAANKPARLRSCVRPVNAADTTAAMMKPAGAVPGSLRRAIALNDRPA